MNYKLIIAKTNGGSDLLLLIDSKVVSRWPHDGKLPQSVDNLTSWDNQAAAGANLSDYQADLDNGKYDVTVINEQSDISVEISLFVGRRPPNSVCLLREFDPKEKRKFWSDDKVVESFVEEIKEHSDWHTAVFNSENASLALVREENGNLHRQYYQWCLPDTKKVIDATIESFSPCVIDYDDINDFADWLIENLNIGQYSPEFNSVMAAALRATADDLEKAN